jgi:hypothetical protein
MPYCKTRKHFWTTQEDAEKCCNGFKRVLVFDQGWDRFSGLCAGVPYGYKWEPIEIKPLFYNKII